jgi:phosphoribosyl-AMP cyclohydrolase
MSESDLLTIDEKLLTKIKFDEKGLIPAVAQDFHTGEVLMLAYVNGESLRRTLETGYATYWSRSRKKLWMKGETSGNVQKVHSIRIDCDGDALVLLVQQTGHACHTGEMSCFHRILAKV